MGVKCPMNSAMMAPTAASEADPDDDHRSERDLRNGVDDDQQGIDGLVDRTELSDDGAERHADHDGDSKADQDFVKRRNHLLEQQRPFGGEDAIEREESGGSR